MWWVTAHFLAVGDVPYWCVLFISHTMLDDANGKPGSNPVYNVTVEERLFRKGRGGKPGIQ